MAQATNILQLFNFINADLSTYKPKPKLEFENGFADAGTSAFDPVGTIDPHYPKSLYLLKPLFSSYPLNPVAPEAQSSIAIPEGLDLDTWIVPEAKPVVHQLEPDDTGVRRKKKKDKKGKSKAEGEGDGPKIMKKKGKSAREPIGEPITREEIEAAEERAKVTIFSLFEA